MTIWLMRITCWINEATNTHYGILITFLLQQLLQDRASMLRPACIACHVLSSLKTDHRSFVQGAGIYVVNTVTISMTPQQHGSLRY
jgi:hypothetical protein